MPRVGDSAFLAAWFDDATGAGLPGLTVKFYLYDPSGNLEVNGANYTITPRAGLYLKPNAFSFDERGSWPGVAVASGGSPSKLQVPFLIEVRRSWSDVVTETAAAVWGALLTAITTPSSIGKLIKDFLDAAISSRSSHSAADVAALVPDVDAIADEAWAGTGRARTLTSLAGLLSSGMVATSGTFVGTAVSVFVGDAYTEGSRNGAIPINDTDLGDLSEATVSVTIKEATTEGEDVVVAAKGGASSISFELTAEQTATLRAGCAFELFAHITDEGNETTLVLGVVNTRRSR